MENFRQRRRLLLLLLVVVSLVLAGCRTVAVPIDRGSPPTLSVDRPVLDRSTIIAEPQTVRDILNNYNMITGYSIRQDLYLDALPGYLVLLDKWYNPP